jgi:hypothetical protein
MKYDYEGPFLELWPTPRRSLIVNQFCFAVRRGAKTVDEVLERVGDDAQKRFAEHGDGTEQGEAQRILLLAIDTDEARNFAEFILWRESLPYEEKQRLKELAGHDYRLAWMEKKPATRKQLKYLEALACHVIPSNMKEASLLIDKYKNGNV